MLCEKCFSEIAEGAAFCKECGHPVPKTNVPGTGEAAPAPVSASSFGNSFVPASYAAPQPVFASAPAAYMGAMPVMTEEGDFYHFDATEKPDFEAIRGISIVLIIISALSVIGILFPMPIAIASLVMSCGGIGERDPRKALDKFNTCRVLVIVAVVTLLLFALAGLIFGLAVGYFSDLPGLMEESGRTSNFF